MEAMIAHMFTRIEALQAAPPPPPPPPPQQSAFQSSPYALWIFCCCLFFCCVWTYSWECLWLVTACIVVKRSDCMFLELQVLKNHILSFRPDIFMLIIPFTNVLILGVDSVGVLVLFGSSFRFPDAPDEKSLSNPFGMRVLFCVCVCVCVYVCRTDQPVPNACSLSSSHLFVPIIDPAAPPRAGGVFQFAPALAAGGDQSYDRHSVCT